MIEKRFKLHIEWYDIEKVEGKATLTDNGQPLIETEQIVDAGLLQTKLNDLYDENKQLKKDNTNLMNLLENQSIIIQELHSKLLEYQGKEPIVLTKEDLKLMDKAISYYTHGRCGE